MGESQMDVETLLGRRNTDRWNRVAVGDMLERCAGSEPHKIALVATPEAVADGRYARVTYAQANDIATRVANGLLAQGLARGDRVAMLVENSVEAYLAKMGIAKAGLVAAPINTMLAPDVVRYALEHVGARVAIVDSGLWDSGGEGFRAAGVTPLVAIGGREEALPDGAAGFADFIAAQDTAEPEVQIHGDDIWQILMTSGTTSMPKAVMISHTYSYFAAYGFAVSASRGVAVESDLCMFSFLPVVYHIGDHAYLLSTFLVGGTIVLGRGFDARAAGETVTREKVTTLWAGSPQFLTAIAAAAEASGGAVDLSSLEVIIYGWAALSPALVAQVRQLCGGRVEFVGIFGQTEAIACHRFWPNRWPELHGRTAPGTNYVGTPAPNLATILLDESGALIPPENTGADGEAVYRSPAMMSGYYRDADATRAAFEHGWFHSGDLCRYGEGGLRIMVDRYKDVVKSGGENVSSIRVESVLHEHPAVARAAVVGVPDERWGEAVTAVVIPAAEKTPEEAELIAFCRERLAGYETPKKIVFVDELPTTVGSKILKYRLREQLRSGELA
ncbi:MAG: AMP-binding protein [Salinisphaera sp.]|nr:AMP-binding protein [Salinisphaera sp.]